MGKLASNMAKGGTYAGHSGPFQEVDVGVSLAGGPPDDEPTLEVGAGGDLSRRRTESIDLCHPRPDVKFALAAAQDEHLDFHHSLACCPEQV